MCDPFVDKKHYKTTMIFGSGYLKWEKMNQVSFLQVSYNDFTFKNIKYEYFCINIIFQTRTLKKFTDRFNWHIWWKTQIFRAPFSEWGSSASRLESVRWVSLLFTTKFPEIPGTHFIDLGRRKGWVNFGATKWFWTKDLCMGNPAP